MNLREKWQPKSEGFGDALWGSFSPFDFVKRLCRPKHHSGTQPLDPSYRPTLSTHPLDPFSLPTLSTHSLDPPSRPTLSTLPRGRQIDSHTGTSRPLKIGRRNVGIFCEWTSPLPSPKLSIYRPIIIHQISLRKPKATKFNWLSYKEPQFFRRHRWISAK